MTERGSVSLAGALDPRGGGSVPAKTLTQLVHVGGSVEHTSAPQTSHVGAPESHLVGPGLPYLTLCVRITGSPPLFHVGLSETATVRRTATTVAYRWGSLQTFRLQLSLSLILGQYRELLVEVGVLLLGDRVSSLYCVEGHRFNLIMPEKLTSLITLFHV